MKILLAVLLITSTSLFARSVSTDLKVDKQFNELSKSLPRQLDAITTIDTVLRSGSKINYIYTLAGKYKGVDVIELFKNKSFFKEYKHSMKKEITNSSCTTPQTKAVLEQGYTTIYFYYDNDGKYIYSFQIQEKDCSNIK